MHKLTILNKAGSYDNLTFLGGALAPLHDNRLLPYPWSMTLVLTRRCNSRCVMCTIWKDKSSPFLSLGQYEEIFSRNDFSFVRAITLTGGEPTLRSDLPQIFDLVLRSMPNLDFVLLATSGLNTRRTIEYVATMLGILERTKNHIKRFVVQISVDGIGEVHDRVRGILGFFERTQSTLRELEELKISHPKLQIVLSTVLMPINIHEAEALIDFSKQRNHPIHFSPVIVSDSYYSNTANAAAYNFEDAESRDLALNFFQKLSNEEKSRLRFYYRDMINMLKGKNRGRRCMMGFYGFVLEHDGNIFHCLTCEKQTLGNVLEESFKEIWFREAGKEIRLQVRKNCCPTCTSSCWTDPVSLREIAELVSIRLLGGI